MGDIVGLVERASETIDQAEAEKLAKRMAKGKFDLEDYASQLKQIAKMGSLSGILGMLPGVGKIKKQLEDANLETTMFKRQAAIIGSMTVAERRNPDLLKASRKKRVAAGSGTSVQEVNKLLKQFDEMSTMMKRMNKMGRAGGHDAADAGGNGRPRPERRSQAVLRKKFFFEKKNQKTSLNPGHGRDDAERPRLRVKKFFCFFLFTKRSA